MFRSSFTAVLFGCMLFGGLACGVAVAQEKAPHRSFHSLLFPPELIVQHRDQLGLTEEQFQRIHEHMQKAGPNAEEAQRKLAPKSQRLAQLLREDKVDERAALKQLEKVLDAERQVNHVHLRAMIRVRNVLTARQQRLLAGIVRRSASQNNSSLELMYPRLLAKFSRINRKLQRPSANGLPLIEATRLVSDCSRHIRARRFQQAEAVLDRVTELLGLGTPSETDKKKENSDQWKQPERPPKIPPPAHSQVPVMKPLSPKAVHREVEALYERNVAWRKIDWKTCLLEGLKRSRDEKKPVILWIFIDRPIDDERC